MKKIVSLITVFLLVFGLCACGNSSEGGGGKGLQVGFNRQSITPVQTGVQIAGGDATSRLSTGFLDEVAATCIAIRKGENTFLVFTMDFMVLNQSALDTIKPTIATTTGIPEDNILLNCTHTHSGVNILETTWDGGEAYRTLVAENSAKAAEKAIADLSPAEVQIGNCDTEGLAFVRHYNMKDGTKAGNGHGTLEVSNIASHAYEAANELQSIKFVRSAEDKKDIMLLSFPAHATTVNATNPTSISACWPGATRAYIEENADIHCAIFQGASGDQNPESKMDGISAAKRDHKKFGQILGDYALGLEYTAVEGNQVVLKSWDYTGNTMKEGTEDRERVAAAAQITSLAKSLGLEHATVTETVKKAGFNNVYEATGLNTRAAAPETRTMTLNVLQLGSDAAMVFAPYEMFGMHGETIKEKSPFAMDFIVTCSEVYNGYLPNIQGCEDNYYEYQVTKFERGTGEKLADLYAATLAELKNAG